MILFTLKHKKLPVCKVIRKSSIGCPVMFWTNWMQSC